MRHLILAFAALALTSGPALAVEPANSQTQAQPASPAVPAAPAARQEMVCKTEPIANSRLRKRKICVTRAQAEVTRQEQKENVRRSMRDNGVQTRRDGS